MQSLYGLVLPSVWQGHVQLGQEKARAEEERLSANSQVKDLVLQRDQLKGKVQDQNLRVDQLNQAVQELQTTERLLEQRAKQLEVTNTGGTSMWPILPPPGDYNVSTFLREKSSRLRRP